MDHTGLKLLLVFKLFIRFAGKIYFWFCFSVSISQKITKYDKFSKKLFSSTVDSIFYIYLSLTLVAKLTLICYLR